MLCKCHWIVLYTVHFTAFSLGGRFFSGHGVYFLSSPIIHDDLVGGDRIAMSVSQRRLEKTRVMELRVGEWI